MREITEIEGSYAYMLVERRGKELSVSRTQRRKEVEICVVCIIAEEFGNLTEVCYFCLTYSSQKAGQEKLNCNS